MRNARPRSALWLVFALAALLLTGFAPSAQSPLVTLAIAAGFDGRFRDGEWMPVIVEVTNGGDAVEGQLVVRPETSGAGIPNTFSAPVSLPEGADQTVILYITARSFAQQVRVELIDNEGVVVAADSAPVHPLIALDRLYVVVTQSAAGSVDLTGAKAGGYAAYQTNWQVKDVPDRAAALGSVNMMLFSDVDTSGLSAAQQQAIADWVTAGGHLIVTGGVSWQATAAGFADLLPFRPSGSESADDLIPLAEWLRRDEADLDAQTVLATGTPVEGAETLVEREGAPLLVRRSLGGGVIDYLTADPNTRPLRGWDGLTDLWLTLATTVGAEPSWSYGFHDWDMAASAVEILPGFNLLPDVLPLCGFLGLYILLIGPLNYVVLARLNRRELAWATIPIFILVFSALSWVLGFNLRGTEATLSRLSVVRAWSDAERAEVSGLIGLLSPRRAEYDLTMTDGSMLRPIVRTAQGNLLTSSVQASVDIEQSAVFKADHFLVDASFIAGFSSDGMMPKPDIGGSASVTFADDTGQQRVRGSIRNNSDQPLDHPVILARGAVLAFEEALQPGEVRSFELTLSGESPPSPGMYAPGVGSASLYFSSYYRNYGSPTNGQTVNDILGEEQFNPVMPDDMTAQEDRRRRLFLGSMVSDFYVYSSANAVAATGRGDRVYLAGWMESAPLAAELEGARWSSDDATLYLVELDTEYVQPTTPVTIPADLFTWMAQDKTAINDLAPLNLALQPGEEVTFRFTPLPSAVLDDVTRLTVRIERGNIIGQRAPIFLYDWQAGEWEEVEMRDGIREIIRPARFLGAQNAVLVRLNADVIGGYLRFDRLTVEQRGTFAQSG